MINYEEVVIVICTEPNENLEKESCILVESIRKFWDINYKIKIFSIQPRIGKELSKNTKEIFDKYHVSHLYLPELNIFPEYKFANKIFAQKYIEENIICKYIIWLDSDIIVLNDISDLLPIDYDISGGYFIWSKTPAFSCIYNSNKSEIEQEQYWKTLYTTCCPAVKIKEKWYLNSGCVITCANKKIFQKSAENFKILFNEIKIKNFFDYFLEEACLSATSLSFKRKGIWFLGLDGYNLIYKNINHRTFLQEKIIHYYDYFDNKQNNIFKNCSNYEKIEWICQKFNLKISNNKFINISL